MKILLTADVPFHGSGLSVLGSTCFKELTELGHEIKTHSLFDHNGIERLLQTEKFDIHLGIGYWANAKEQIELPKKHGLKTALWWVSEANVPKNQSIIPEADLLLVTSNYSKNIFEKYVSGSKPQVLHIGCDTDFYKNPNPTYQPPKIFSTFVSSGEVKGCEEALTSVNLLAPKGLQYKYVIHSPYTEYRLEKDYMLRLQNIVKSRRLEPWVTLMSDVKIPDEKMPSIYQSMYAYICSMRMGCFGIPIIEAGSMGTPTIAGNWEPMSEIIKDGETGILVPHMAKAIIPKYMEGMWFTEEYKMIDSITLAEKIQWLIEHPEERKRMGENARKHIVENFDSNKQIKKLSLELEKL